MGGDGGTFNTLEEYEIKYEEMSNDSSDESPDFTLQQTKVPVEKNNKITWAQVKLIMTKLWTIIKNGNYIRKNHRFCTLVGGMVFEIKRTIWYGKT